MILFDIIDRNTLMIHNINKLKLKLNINIIIIIKIILKCTGLVTGFVCLLTT